MEDVQRCDSYTNGALAAAATGNVARETENDSVSIISFNDPSYGSIRKQASEGQQSLLCHDAIERSLPRCYKQCVTNAQCHCRLPVSQRAIWCLYTLDCLFGILVIAPSVAMVWGAIWRAGDNVLGNLSERANHVLSLSFGWLLQVFLLLLIPLAHVVPNLISSKYLVYATEISRRIFHVVLAIACVLHWRGVWWVTDTLTGTGFASQILSMIGGSLILSVFRVSRSSMNAPIILHKDNNWPGLRRLTRFGAPVSRNWRWAVDVALTTALVPTLVAIRWRGGFGVMDLALAPGKPGLSALFSALIGFPGTLFILLAFPVLGKLLNRWEDFKKRSIATRAIESLGVLGLTFTGVNLWRAVWLVTDKLLGDTGIVSIVTFFTGLLVLVLTGTVASLPFYGVVHDGWGLIIHVQYFSLGIPTPEGTALQDRPFDETDSSVQPSIYLRCFAPPDDVAGIVNSQSSLFTSQPSDASLVL